jgi:uncharacterized membrane protein YhaH (DUF805 family)
MKLKFSDLRHWEGQIDRAPFLLWAVLLFAVKSCLDRLALGLVFHRDWSPFSYFEKVMPWPAGLTPARNPGEFALLLALALPFLWLGLVLCVKRLRSAALPLSWAVFFVIPILKWFLFLLLALVPPRPSPAAVTTLAEDAGQGWSRWFPESTFASAALAVALSALLGLGAMVLSTQLLKQYGWGIFVGAPFCLGFLAALIHGTRHRRTLSDSLVVALAAVALAGGAVLLLAFEGAICLVMAAPLAALLALIGACLGHAVQASRWQRLSPQLYCLPILAVPLMFGAERLQPRAAPLLQVTTTIEVNAKPRQVWRQLVSIAQLSPPQEVLFRLGIAYPIRAEIEGSGVGALRHCVFSTGSFEEPIEVWDEPRLLRFSVTQNPAPMEEWTPYHHIHPPHLEGFLVSQQGQFLLTPLPGGRTRLEGTTWYYHHMWPAAYWQLWSDHIIHSIHRRVLKHVKELAEKEEA